MRFSLTALLILISILPLHAQADTERPLGQRVLKNGVVRWIYTRVTGSPPVDPELEDLMVLRAKVEALEQVATYGGPEKQRCGADQTIQQMCKLIVPFEFQLKLAGIEGHSLPPDESYEHWDGKLLWASRLHGENDVKRCKDLHLAYIFAVYGLTTEEPSVPIHGMKDMRIKKHDGTWISDDALLKDRERAAWQLRFIQSTPRELVPALCLEIVQEAEKRWKFIYSAERRPLGFAIGMCGRSLSAHYLDDEVNNTRSAPKGWTELSRSECP
jgi:hypothetical protein